MAAYIRTHPGSVPTVKQHLAAIRALCDWLVVHQVLPANPAAAVRGPKHVVTKGATPVLTPAETRVLLGYRPNPCRNTLEDSAWTPLTGRQIDFEALSGNVPQWTGQIRMEWTPIVPDARPWGR